MTRRGFDEYAVLEAIDADLADRVSSIKVTSMTINRLLVVAEPWADLLVDGAKTWELRTTSTKVRGVIGIAEKGTGTIIGTVELIDVHGPFNRDEIDPYEHLHRVPASSVSTYSGPKGLYAWEMTNAIRFETPVPYSHPQGAVIWVRPLPPVVVPL